MSAQAMVLEFGMGVDVHGEEGTKAACRAVSDAIRHSSLPLFTDVRAKGGRMLVDVTVGVPDPGAVDVERVKNELPHGEVTVHPVAGGLRVPGADTIIACAAITVSVEYPGDERGIGLKRLQHLVLWVSNVERSVRFYCDVLGFEVKTQYPNAAFLYPGTQRRSPPGPLRADGGAGPTRAWCGCTTRPGKSAR